MQTFISDISGKSFPVAKKTRGNLVRNGLLSELEIRMLHEKMDQLIITQEENLPEMQQLQMDMLQEITQKMNSYKDNTLDKIS